MFFCHQLVFQDDIIIQYFDLVCWPPALASRTKKAPDLALSFVIVSLYLAPSWSFERTMHWCLNFDGFCLLCLLMLSIIDRCKIFQLSGAFPKSLEKWRKMKMGEERRQESWQHCIAAQLASKIVRLHWGWGATWKPTGPAWRRPGALWTSSCDAFTPRRRCLPGTRRSTTSTPANIWSKRLVPFQLSFQDHFSFLRLGLKLWKGYIREQGHLGTGVRSNKSCDFGCMVTCCLSSI